MDQVAPPGIDLEANQQGRLVSSMIALIILPTIFVILRLISRKVSQAGYWVRSPVANLSVGLNTDFQQWDDVWVTIACVSISLTQPYTSFALTTFRHYVTFNAYAS